VLSGTPDPEVPYWNKAEVYRQGKLILQYSDKELELEGSPGIFLPKDEAEKIMSIFNYKREALTTTILDIKSYKRQCWDFGHYRKHYSCDFWRC